jgi:hypothetical protein
MSTLNVSNITDGTDTVETGYVLNGSAKAWVNFNGTGTIAIKTSFNVSSISDVNTGQYQVDFTSAMASPDHCTTLAVSHSSSADEGADLSTSVYSASNYRVNNREGGGTYRDPIRFCCDTNGDLA